MNDTVVIDRIIYSTEAIKCDPGPQIQSLVSIFRNLDLYFIWKLNK